MTEAATIRGTLPNDITRMKIDAQMKAAYIDGKMENTCALFELFRAVYIDISPAETAMMTKLVCKERSNIADIITQMLADMAEAAEFLSETIQKMNRATA